MNWPSAPSGGPNEDLDVIVEFLQTHEAPTGHTRDVWTVWLGTERHAEYGTKEEAIAAARQLARKHSRAAWLRDKSNYPLQPIEL